MDTLRYHQIPQRTSFTLELTDELPSDHGTAPWRQTMFVSGKSEDCRGNLGRGGGGSDGSPAWSGKASQEPTRAGLGRRSRRPESPEEGLCPNNEHSLPDDVRAESDNWPNQSNKSLCSPREPGLVSAVAKIVAGIERDFLHLFDR